MGWHLTKPRFRWPSGISGREIEAYIMVIDYETLGRNNTPGYVYRKREGSDMATSDKPRYIFTEYYYKAKGNKHTYIQWQQDGRFKDRIFWLLLVPPVPDKPAKVMAYEGQSMDTQILDQEIPEGMPAAEERYAQLLDHFEGLLLERMLEGDDLTDPQ